MLLKTASATDENPASTPRTVTSTSVSTRAPTANQSPAPKPKTTFSHQRSLHKQALVKVGTRLLPRILLLPSLPRVRGEKRLRLRSLLLRPVFRNRRMAIRSLFRRRKSQALGRRLRAKELLRRKRTELLLRARRRSKLRSAHHGSRSMDRLRPQ